jgi:hypothetical protein
MIFHNVQSNTKFFQSPPIQTRYAHIPDMRVLNFMFHVHILDMRVLDFIHHVHIRDMIVLNFKFPAHILDMRAYQLSSIESNWNKIS